MTIANYIIAFVDRSLLVYTPTIAQTIFIKQKYRIPPQSGELDNFLNVIISNYLLWDSASIVLAGYPEKMSMGKRLRDCNNRYLSLACSLQT